MRFMVLYKIKGKTFRLSRIFTERQEAEDAQDELVKLGWKSWIYEYKIGRI